MTEEILFGWRVRRGGQQTQGLVEATAKSAAPAVGSQAGRALLRGVVGSPLGSGRPLAPARLVSRAVAAVGANR